MKLLAIFNKNFATIFQLQWNIGNILDVFLQYFVLCGIYSLTSCKVMVLNLGDWPLNILLTRHSRPPIKVILGISWILHYRYSDVSSRNFLTIFRISVGSELSIRKLGILRKYFKKIISQNFSEIIFINFSTFFWIRNY